ncbi:hypothetical protein Q8F55_007637 [Vanrija albida]|uniref:FAD-binding FR-type domain-containing protein n=1 Tax=Vanrija albida TaxID=181172 RepID=A0ABR3PU27_9TREE
MRANSAASRSSLAAALLIAVLPQCLASKHVPGIPALRLQTRPGLCYEACESTLHDIRFADEHGKRNKYTRRASSVLWLTSAVHCMDKWCAPGDVREGYDVMRDILLQHADVDIGTDSDKYRNATLLEACQDVHTLSREAEKRTFNTTILPQKHDWEVAYNTLHTWDVNMIYHHGFGEFLYVLLGILLAFGLFDHLVGWLRQSGARVTTGDNKYTSLADASSFDLAGGSWAQRYLTWYRKHIDTPALFGYRHVQAAWGGWASLPTRLESIVIGIYIAANVLFTLGPYPMAPENRYWPGRPDQELSRYIADRTGIMCFWNLPLLWALAGRNNVVLWLTSWSYSSLNMFHRWVARVATAQATIHSLAYLYYGLANGKTLKHLWGKQYWAMGVIATAVMIALLPLSLRPLRESAYELFLRVHVALAFACLVLLFYHVDVMDGAYDAWLWWCIGLWAFDYVLRLARIGILSFNAIGQRNTYAEITGGGNGLLRFAIHTTRRFEPKPGSYFFLYTPYTLAPWENHPMTLGSWSTAQDGMTLDFLIAPKAGATQRMKRNVIHSGGRTNISVLLEGPYGESHDLSGFDHVLLVSGGGGVTGILPYVNTLAQHQRQRRIDVVWVVPSVGYAVDVCARELAPKHTPGINVRVYMSREQGVTAQDVVCALPPDIEVVCDADDDDADPPAEDGNESDTALEEGEQSSLLKTISSEANSTRDANGKLSVSSGRPCMRALLSRAVNRLEGRERLVVLSCGPAAMMDDLRAAVCETYGDEHGQVSGDRLVYYEDAFGW